MYIYDNENTACSSDGVHTVSTSIVSKIISTKTKEQKHKSHYINYD